MHRLITRVLSLLITFVTCVVVARQFGYQEPVPFSITQHHLLDCVLPCWAGVQIGETKLPEATTLLRQAYPAYQLIEQRAGADLRYQNNGKALAFWEVYLQQKSIPAEMLTVVFGYNFPNTTVREVDLMTSSVSHLPSILELSEVFGEPTCVAQNSDISNTPLMVVYQPANAANMYIMARIMNRGMGWRQPVNEIKLVTRLPDKCKEWQGYTNLSKHLCGGKR